MKLHTKEQAPKEGEKEAPKQGPVSAPSAMNLRPAPDNPPACVLDARLVLCIAALNHLNRLACSSPRCAVGAHAQGLPQVPERVEGCVRDL